MLVGYLLALPLAMTLFQFMKFHLRLITENYTTIENLERDEGARSKFDIGAGRNWEQVFGPSRGVWWVPLHTKLSRPAGDGVRWRVHYSNVVDEDEELPHDDRHQNMRLLRQF